MGFDAKDKKVYDLLNRNSFVMPRNQRRYVWNKRNWNEFLEDVLLVIEGKAESHFIGSIVLKDEGRKNGLPTYTIIDGQQRITTIILLLGAIVYMMRQHEMQDDFLGSKQYLIAVDDKNRDTVMVSSEYHSSMENLIKAIVQPDSEMLSKSLQSFIDSVITRKQDKIIADVFRFFVVKIQELLASATDKEKFLLDLRDGVVNITYVSVISSTDEDSYTIFEILNARGMELEDHELLKNYIMRYMHPVENRDKAKETWTEIETILGSQIGKFIKHYTIHRFGYDKELSDYKQIQQNSKKVEVDSLLQDLRRKTEMYVKLISPVLESNGGSCTLVEYKIFSFFKRKKYMQMRPVLLSIMERYLNGDIDSERYNSILSYLHNYYVCYNIIGEQNSNKLTTCVNKYALSIGGSSDAGIINDFLRELYAKMPSYEAFLNSMNGLGWSHHKGYFEGEKNKERVQTVLEVIERHKNNDLCCDDFTIEHIYDDSEGIESASIGNLLPLEEHLNRRCVKKSFEEKCNVYKDSNFKMARNFGNRHSGKNSFSIKDRTEIMAKELYHEIIKIGDGEPSN